MIWCDMIKHALSVPRIGGQPALSTTHNRSKTLMRNKLKNKHRLVHCQKCLKAWSGSKPIITICHVYKNDITPLLLHLVWYNCNDNNINMLPVL